MSGDLEDFLKRAAQRRQNRAPQQQTRGQPTSGPGQSSRREYTDSRSERLPQAVPAGEEADEVMMGEIVTGYQDDLAEKQREIAESKKKAAAAEKEAQKKLAEARKGGRTTPVSSDDLSLSGNPAEDVMRMLKNPGGLRQAVLLKEILDRPEHRW